MVNKTIPKRSWLNSTTDRAIMHGLHVRLFSEDPGRPVIKENDYVLFMAIRNQNANQSYVFSPVACTVLCNRMQSSYWWLFDKHCSSGHTLRLLFFFFWWCFSSTISSPANFNPTASCHGRITHSEESAIRPLPNTRAHTFSWPSRVDMIDRGTRVCYSSHPESPGKFALYDIVMIQSLDDRVNAFTGCTIQETHAEILSKNFWPAVFGRNGIKLCFLI